MRAPTLPYHPFSRSILALSHIPSKGSAKISQLNGRLLLQDKVGPLARTAQDAAVILDVIRGKDGIDTSACNVALPSPFTIDVTNLTVGYLPDTPAAVRTCTPTSLAT